MKAYEHYYNKLICRPIPALQFYMLKAAYHNFHSQIFYGVTIFSFISRVHHIFSIYSLCIILLVNNICIRNFNNENFANYGTLKRSGSLHGDEATTTMSATL